MIEWLSSEIKFLKSKYPANIDGVVPFYQSKKTRQYFHLRLREKRDNLELELTNFVRTRIQEEYERLERLNHSQRKLLENVRKNKIFGVENKCL